MDAEEFARFLASDERRRWQDPIKIGEAIGVTKGMTVADLACGPGFFAIPWARLVGETGLVYAVDSNPTMLRHLQAGIRESRTPPNAVKVLLTDVSKTGIPSACVDVTLFANVLHDLPDKEAFLREVRRIAKPRGAVVDVDWKKTNAGLGPPTGIRLSEAGSEKILHENGFTVTRRIDAGPYHYGLVLHRREGW
ncbi:MAG: methyltransferase domain-containing protein [Nitrososphaerota archaeon]|nr:methyltransferase domain-containing protein [Nitrososphaerota archaeon]